ncbi:MAG: CDP-glycerol glycerophosphotransferase family protein [Erysipelotrichaceae bacterium]|nr:CDP-glycerol glycerophosphotransferase family protein [Erysipelotrichaceae bacterium]
MHKIRVFLVNIAKKSDFFRKLLRIGMFSVRRGIYLFFYPRKVNQKRVLFEAFMGRKYADSPKAIYEYMLNCDDYSDYEFVWFFLDPSSEEIISRNPRTKIVKHGSVEYYKMYATSKYWVTNSRVTDAILKKKDQVYLQCWHGTPLKKLGFDIKVESGNAMNSIKDIHYKYQVDSKKYTWLLSPSKFCTEKFTSAFNLKAVGKDDIIIEKGYPRNDYLINYQQEDVDKIKKSLNLPMDKKVILYAPTWRDNQHKSGLGYTYKTEVDFDRLRKELSDEYVILFRAHYFVANQFDFSKYAGFVFDASSYNEINDLYIISDLLITDYSSVFFDFSILKRPIIFYMYDLDEYQHVLRDFYISLDELPGRIVENEDDLLDAIKDAQSFTYDEKYKKFNDTYTYLDDGQAAKRVVEFVFKKE